MTNHEADVTIARLYADIMKQVHRLPIANHDQVHPLALNSSDMTINRNKVFDIIRKSVQETKMPSSAERRVMCVNKWPEEGERDFVATEVAPGEPDEQAIARAKRNYGEDNEYYIS